MPDIDDHLTFPFDEVVWQPSLGEHLGGSDQVWFDDWELQQLEIPDPEDPEAVIACVECLLQECRLDFNSDYEGELWEVAAGSWDE